MKRFLVIGPVLAACTGLVVAAQSPVPQGPTQASFTNELAPTFSKHVAPIFNRHCVACHRPGEAAPMSLLTYEQARPYANAILTAVTKGTMPPWHADAPPGTFHDERILTDVERRTIREWVQGGARRGDTRDLAAPPVFTEGWRIGTPDVVFEMPFDYEIKASGTIDYEYIYIPTNFTEAKWVTAIEIRPGNRRAVHHANLYYRAVPDSPRVLAKPNLSDRRSSPQREPDTALHSRREFADRPQRNIAHYAPGTNPQVAPSGTAYRLEAGGLLELQMHYTAIGELTGDRTRVGIIFSTDPAPRELYAQTFYNTIFTLPAGAPNVSVSTDLEFVSDAQLWGLWPHSHLRGKRWKYELVMADGSTTTILSVPNYDFNWQTYYMFAAPLQVPKGAKIVSTAWYDNSAANKHNPDPTVDVTSGKQTWDEMQYTGALLSAPEP